MLSIRKSVSTCCRRRSGSRFAAHAVLCAAVCTLQSRSGKSSLADGRSRAQHAHSQGNGVLPVAWQCPNSSALPLPSSASAAATGSCRSWPWGVRCRAWLYTMRAAKRRCVRGVQAGWPANVHQNMNVHGHIWIVGIKSACKTGRLCLPTSALASAPRRPLCWHAGPRCRRRWRCWRLQRRSQSNTLARLWR